MVYGVLGAEIHGHYSKAIFYPFPSIPYLTYSLPLNDTEQQARASLSLTRQIEYMSDPKTYF